MPMFERCLGPWVFPCTIMGVALGHLLPGVSSTVATMSRPDLISTSASAAVVGLPIVVPGMHSVVWIVNSSKGWYESGLKAKT